MHIVFLSDFDNTISGKDFYWLVIERFRHGEGKRLYQEWQNDQISDVVFLNTVFSWINLEADELEKLILEIPVDISAVSLAHKFIDAGHEFHIVSAGCRYYIEVLMRHNDFPEQVRLFANPGVYVNGHIEMQPDQHSPFYHPVHGIDKAAVLRSFRRNGHITAFAGDSKPDLAAALCADKVFARRNSQLETLLKAQRRPFESFEDFNELSCLF